tara:strand:- start:27873 stop:28040 length:168 start_codon:yes stop_codon:yes gene_type:complete
MRKYIVTMTISQWVEAHDEDDAVEEAKHLFEYGDLHDAEVEVEEAEDDNLCAAIA